MTQSDLTGVSTVTFHDPFEILCEDGTVLRGDTGQVNRVTRDVHLLGNVYFEDPSQTLSGSEATYSPETGRLWARGDVVFVNRIEGSTLRGPELEYFKENEERPEAQVFATGRPTLVREQRDSTGAADPNPMTIVADRLTIVGEDDLSAFDDVVITQTGLEATSGEARFDSEAETLELRQSAVIRKDDYELTGEVIQALMTDGSLQHVQSRTRATLTGEDLDVSAPDLQLFFVADTLQRVTARVPAEVTGERARAASRTFRMEADSIDATFAEQLLREVHAIGAARGETIDTTASVTPAPAFPVAAPADSAAELMADSVSAAPADSTAALAADSVTASGDAITAGPSAPVTATDWIRGDTIVAFFESSDSAAARAAVESSAEAANSEADDPALSQPPAPEEPAVQTECAAEPCDPANADAAAEPRTELRRLIARGQAQSFYRLRAENAANDSCRNLSFLVGDEIDLDVIDGELEVANVTGLKQGIYLEATACAVEAPNAGLDPASSIDPDAPADEAPLPSTDALQNPEPPVTP